MSYTHFTLKERKYLQQLLSEGKSFREIASILERSPSTISREVKRNKAKYRPHNKTDNKYWYNHWRAQNLYIRRRRGQQRRSLKPGSEEWEYILEGLKRYWSPESICGRWQLSHPNSKPLSVSTIYRYLKSKELPEVSAQIHLRRRNKRHYPRNSNYNTIHPDRIIPEWPEDIRLRTRIGDWEGDTVYGAVGKGLLVTLVDRKSRYLCSGLLQSRNAKETRERIERLLNDMPVESISLDNGSEFCEFRQIEENLKTKIYFAEPHKPWQRGTNENTNDILRFFYPKGTDFHKVSEEDLEKVVYLINTRPRKCLNWKSPFEVFWGVALA